MTGLVLDDRNLGAAAVTTPAIADDALSADVAGRGKMQDGFLDEATLLAKVAAGAMTPANAAAIIANDALESQHYAPASVDGEHISTDGKQIVLNSKFLATWLQFSQLSTTAGAIDVTTAVEAAATVDTARGAVTAAGLLTSNSTLNLSTGNPDNYKVQIREAAGNQPVDDGAGGEVYGVLSFSAAVYSMSYYTAADVAFFPPASVTYDFLVAEIFGFNDVPGTALLAGPTFGDISSTTGTHTHLLASITDVTATAAELNKLDGADGNVTPSNLNELTGAGDTTLHKHDGLYRTEGELSAIGTGNPNTTAGASLVGTDASALGPVAGSTDTTQGVLEAIVAALGTERANETIATINQTTDVALVDNLDFTPIDGAKVGLKLNGLEAINGINFTISGKIITWLGATFELKSTDTLRAFYRSSD